MYVQGVSTRKVKAITEQLCGVEVSATQVSRAAAQMDENGKRWKPLDKLLGLQPYQRNSPRVQELACNMALSSSYRETALWLSEIVKTPISASSIGRKVHKVWASAEANENAFRFRG